MTHTPEIHHRRSIRLPEYDYAQPGAYFVTICAAQAECLFGEVVDDVVIASEFGLIARDEWFRSAEIRSEIVLLDEEFVVMPNHIHGIVRIVGVGVHVGATGRSPLRSMDDTHAPSGPPPHSLGALLAGYKAAVTKRINQVRGMPGMSVWQRNYWEHVIRNDADMDRIREYIAHNPARWADDQLYARAQPNRFNQD